MCARALCEACAEGFNRERAETDEWGLYGRLSVKSGQPAAWTEEGHLADRGKTDEWTRSGNKSVWKQF